MAIDYANKQLKQTKNKQNEKHQQSNHRSIHQHLRS